MFHLSFSYSNYNTCHPVLKEVLGIWKQYKMKRQQRVYKQPHNEFRKNTTGLRSSSMISCACLSRISTTFAGNSASIKMCKGSFRCSYPGRPLKDSSLKSKEATNLYVNRVKTKLIMLQTRKGQIRDSLP